MITTKLLEHDPNARRFVVSVLHFGCVPFESVSLMARVCCLAGIEENKVGTFATAVRQAGISGTPIVARLRVTELGNLDPDLLVCDLDRLNVDPLELLRQIRFVLPKCVIAVYSDEFTHSWTLSCHLAGANCLLSKESTGAQLSMGLREGLQNGCFTDPRFEATLHARTS